MTADQLVSGGIMRQLFMVAFSLIGQMAKTNRAWQTQEDEGISAYSAVTKEIIKKDQNHDENMAQIMTQLDLMTSMLCKLLQEVTIIISM